MGHPPNMQICTGAMFKTKTSVITDACNDNDCDETITSKIPACLVLTQLMLQYRYRLYNHTQLIS